MVCNDRPLLASHTRIDRSLEPVTTRSEDDDEEEDVALPSLKQKQIFSQTKVPAILNTAFHN
jgi:hypothetical protein